MHGWLKVHSFTEPAEKILEYFPWQVYHLNQWQPVELLNTQIKDRHIIVQLQGCTTPEAAKTYTNNSIAIAREQLPALPADEYYWSDLIGLKVINHENVDFGIVESVMATGSNDVLIVKGDRRRLLPYTHEVIIEVNLKMRIIKVDWEADF